MRGRKKQELTTNNDMPIPYTFRVIIEPDGKKFHGYVPSLPGCHTFGETIEITKLHLREAIQVYVESVMKEGHPIPIELGLESFETVFLLPKSQEVYA
jgi:predicted RNase H-like HicB family nuclease